MTLHAYPKPADLALAVDVDVPSRTIRLRGELDEATRHLVDEGLRLLISVSLDDILLDASGLRTTADALEMLSRWRIAAKRPHVRVLAPGNVGGPQYPEK